MPCVPCRPTNWLLASSNLYQQCSSWCASVSCGARNCAGCAQTAHRPGRTCATRATAPALRCISIRPKMHLALRGVGLRSMLLCLGIWSPMLARKSGAAGSASPGVDISAPRDEPPVSAVHATLGLPRSRLPTIGLRSKASKPGHLRICVRPLTSSAAQQRRAPMLSPPHQCNKAASH